MAAREGAQMGVVIELTGTNEALRCLAAARTAETYEEEVAWLRLHRRYMTRYAVDGLDLSFGDDTEGLELRRVHVGA
jgi:hypothetical protein